MRFAALALLLALGGVRTDGSEAHIPITYPATAGVAFKFAAPQPGAYTTVAAATGQTISCTRASSATYQTAATYTATTQPSTNVFPQSGNLHDVAWNNAGLITPNVGTAPDGTNSLAQLNGACAFQNGPVQSSFTNTGPFTVSGYFQQADASNTTAGLYGYCGAVAVTSCTCQRDDATACTASSAGLGGTLCTATSTVGTTTQRFSLTWSCATPPAGGGAALCAGLYPGTGNIKAWGGQAEALGVETNYIPTVASGVSRGLVQTATTNQCAVDYRGLQVEGGVTNLALRSEAFDDAAWTKTSVTVTANSTIAPDGNLTADTLTGTGAGGLVLSTSTTAAAAVYTSSVWAKVSAGTQGGLLKIFDVTGGSDYCSASITATTTWQRFTCVGGSAATAGHALAIRFFPGGAGTGTVIAWGAQLEQSPFATSYIATAAATATRAGDTVSVAKPGSVTMAGGSALYSFSLTAQVEGLFTATAQEGVGSNASFVPLFQVQDNSANRVSAYSDTVPTAATYTVAGLDAMKTSQAVRYAMNVAAGKVQACANGLCGTQVSVGAQPSEPTTLFLGCFNGGAAPLYGWLSAACTANTATGCAP